MNTRPFGLTGLEVGEIGFGAWAIGGAWGNDVPESEAIDTLLACFENGIDFLDTAHVYGDGRSERLIAEAIKQTDKKITVATKLKRMAYDDSYEQMEALAKEQVRRLGVDALDLIQLHCEAFDRLQAGHLFENMERLRANGLVRFTGASVETIEEAIFTIENSNCDALQVIFNLFRQRLITDLFPELNNRVVAIIARVPLASGVLTGKFHKDHTFEQGDHRGFNANGEFFNVGETFAGVPFDLGIDFAHKIQDLLKQHGRHEPLSQLALRWILDFPEVSVVIPGGKRPDQVKANAAASYLPPISPELHRALYELYSHEIDPTVRGPY